MSALENVHYGFEHHLKWLSPQIVHYRNLELREPVSQDWPLVYLELLARCPEAEDRQGTADLAAPETPKGVASLPAPLHFWAEETKRSAR